MGLIKYNSHYNKIVLYIHNLGKEEVLIHLSEAFKTKIGVNEDRMKFMKAIGMFGKKDYDEIFTINQNDAWILTRAVPEFRESLYKEPLYLHILLSGR